MIHISLTTIPERIKNFEFFYNCIMSGSMTPDFIHLQVYPVLFSSNIIPPKIRVLENVIINEHTEDKGPILKFTGVYNEKQAIQHCAGRVPGSLHLDVALSASLPARPNRYLG